MSATARRTSWISLCSSRSLRGASIAGPCSLLEHSSPLWSKIIGLPTKSIRSYLNKDCRITRQVPYQDFKCPVNAVYQELACCQSLGKPWQQRKYLMLGWFNCGLVKNNCSTFVFSVGD